MDDPKDKPDDGLLKPMGSGETDPGPKEADSLAALPDHLAQTLPDAAVPSSSDSASDSNMPPASPEVAINPKKLDPHGVMSKRDVFPGIGGIPFRGPVPDLKNDDKPPETGYQAHVEILDLADKVQLTRYTEIMQVCANGMGQIGAEERIYDKQVKNWRVFIRWWELFLHKPSR